MISWKRALSPGLIFPPEIRNISELQDLETPEAWKCTICKNSSLCLCCVREWLKSANGRDVTKRAIIDINSIVSGQNYINDILTSIIAQLLTSRPSPNLCRNSHIVYFMDISFYSWSSHQCTHGRTHPPTQPHTHTRNLITYTYTNLSRIILSKGSNITLSVAQ